jgi:hypothetical protein
MEMILSVADKIFENLQNIKSSYEKTEYITEKEHKFYTRYPNVIRHMIEDNMYSHEAFSYIIKMQQDATVQRAMNSDESSKDVEYENFINIQAEYTRQLYLSKKSNKNKANKEYEKSLILLKKICKEAESGIKNYEDNSLKNKKKELLDFVIKHSE